ncbi:MAG TPA: hypothetical protein DCQ06_11925 [Myxococcales bacterium]|nr:hypothetical protein [Myxococcales bacterium]HAN32296.1 hypothetical protein [Myxococcales bacterium]
MFLLYFALLLVPLVFFHELGHFLVAKWMGVRVLSFSIGFGPVVLQWNSGGTQYAIRALPLGGFVKMLGENDDEQDDQQEPDGPPAPDSFAAKAVWRRTLIIAAGPVANLLLPIVIIFVGSMLFDAQVVSSRVGTVLPGGPAASAGLQAGDRIVSVDGEAIAHFQDLVRVVSARPGKEVQVRFERQGQSQTISLTTESKTDPRLSRFGIFDAVGRIQVLPNQQDAVVAVDPDSAAFAAGLRNGDLIETFNDKKVESFWHLSQLLHKGSNGSTCRLQVQPLLQSGADKKTETRQVEFDCDRDLAIRPAESVIGPVKGDSAVAHAKLLAGDELLSVDGKPVRSLFELTGDIQQRVDRARVALMAEGYSGPKLAEGLRGALGKALQLKVRRVQDGRFVQVQLSLHIEIALDRRSQVPYVNLGLRSAQRHGPPELIANPNSIAFAYIKTVEGMWHAVKTTALTVVGLFSGRVPMREVGGPIMMAQLASRAAELGWASFFHLMVVLSVNLAILNLLPIPLVDGGQLLFLAVEAVKREPLSLKTRMIASYVGLGFLVFVFVMVMKNDVERLIASLVGAT